MNIGMKIKKARLERGLTQEQLGEKVGVQKSAIAKYENGRITNMKRSTIEKLAIALEMRPSEFIFVEENKPAENLAELHAQILLDCEVMSMIEEYYSLPPDKKKIIKNFIHSLTVE